MLLRSLKYTINNVKIQARGLIKRDAFTIRVTPNRVKIDVSPINACASMKFIELEYKYLNFKIIVRLSLELVI